ncbi:unnamed protein product [Sphenostylis stenocarpa]|uniref:Uncharacterized protein n=1 Tax=Sphenostylis stenocarpa TaxID=92480 RepID=A0AA86VXN8_9FABA|nr:unnamed protein product [Sphenostylis stenocarpa]
MKKVATVSVTNRNQCPKTPNSTAICPTMIGNEEAAQSPVQACVTRNRSRMLSLCVQLYLIYSVPVSYFKEPSYNLFVK